MERDDDLEDEEEGFANEGEARDALRESLIGMQPLAEVLGRDDLLDTISALIAIVEAPGKLDMQAVGPVFEALSRELAEVFGEGAEEAEGELKEQLEQAQRTALEDAESLSRDRRSKPN